MGDAWQYRQVVRSYGLERRPRQDDARRQPRLSDEALGRSGCGDPALVHQQHLVAVFARLLHVMGGRHNRHTTGVLPPEVLPEPEAKLRVEAGGGFVQEHDFGVAHKSERDVDAPLLAARKRAILFGKTAIESQFVAQLRQGDGRPVERGEQAQRLARLHARRNSYLLQLHAYLVDEPGAVGHGVQSGDENRAGIRLTQPFEALDGGGLAGAVWTDHAEDAPALHLEAHVVHSHHIAVNLSQRLHLQREGVRESHVHGLL